MQRGLEGRRIALVGSDSNAMEIRKELVAAGAIVDELLAKTEEERWHGARYAAMVLAGAGEGDVERVAQLVRELMVSSKPVAAFDVDTDALRVDASLLTVQGNGDARAFAQDVVQTFSQELEEHDLDDMSDQSFPASDPPAVNPGVVKRVAPEGEARG